MPVNVDGRDAIDALIDWHLEKYAPLAPSRPLFPSRNKKGTVAVNRQSAHDMLKAAFMAAGLNGKIATHSLRTLTNTAFGKARTHTTVKENYKACGFLFSHFLFFLLQNNKN